MTSLPRYHLSMLITCFLPSGQYWVWPYGLHLHVFLFVIWHCAYWHLVKPLQIRSSGLTDDAIDLRHFVSMEFCCVSYPDFLHNNLLFYTRVVPSLHIFSRLQQWCELRCPPACMLVIVSCRPILQRHDHWVEGGKAHSYICIYVHSFVWYGNLIKDRRWWVLLEHAFCI